MVVGVGGRHDPLAGLRTELRLSAATLPDVMIGVVDGIPDLAHPLLHSARLEIAKERSRVGWRPRHDQQ
jgi:hypothetical protein